MTHPLYDPSSLTDDEILTKLGKCYTYVADQERLGHDPTVDSIKKTIAALESERMERFEKMMREGADAPKPQLEPITLGTLDTDKDNKNED